MLGASGAAAPIGHPQNALLFFTSRLYLLVFQNFQLGYASAVAWVRLLITAASTLLVVRNSKRWVFQQGAFR